MRVGALLFASLIACLGAAERAVSQGLEGEGMPPLGAPEAERPLEFPEPGPGFPPGLPHEQPPMVVPPPGEAPADNPDAFGSLPVPGADEAPALADPTKPGDLDQLFTELRREPSEEAAQRIAARIENRWRSSGSATVDLLMRRAAEAMTQQKQEAALDLLDQAIVLDPDFAEAWNRRATLNFMIDRWGKSLADIEQTLRREPRHWGALMGLAAILERTGHDQRALETYMRVLEIYPTLESAQMAVGRLADDLTGPAI